MMDIRQFPQQEERVETGVIQFGDDWPMVVIRGDNALHYAMMLKMFLSGQLHQEDIISKMYLEGLVNLLNSCDARNFIKK